MKWILGGIHINFENLREHIKTIEKLIKQEQVNFTQRIEEEAKQLSIEERDDFYEWYSDKYWHLNDVFPDLNRNSIFLVAFSNFEYELFSISRIISKELSPDSKIDEYSGNGIEKVKKYFNRVLEIPFPSETQEWNKIQIYKKIRNIIVHNGGKVRKIESNENLMSFINNEKFISLDNFNRIHLEPEFVNTVLYTFENFIVNFINSIRQA